MCAQCGKRCLQDTPLVGGGRSHTCPCGPSVQGAHLLSLWCLAFPLTPAGFHPPVLGFQLCLHRGWNRTPFLK